MYKECACCKAANMCLMAVEPGSVMCQMNRLRSGQTKAELEREKKKRTHALLSVLRKAVKLT